MKSALHGSRLDRAWPSSTRLFVRGIAGSLLALALLANVTVAAEALPEGSVSLVPSLAPLVLSGKPAGSVELPQGALVRTIDTSDRWLLVALETREGPDLFVFQSNPKPNLRLIWKQKIRGGVSTAIFANGSLWVATREAESRLLQISIGSGVIENELTLPDPIRLLEGGFRLGAYGPKSFFRMSQEDDGHLSAVALGARFFIEDSLIVGLLATQPASAAVWDSRRPRKIEVFEDFLQSDQGFQFSDSGADGAFGVACLGDSNTFSNHLRNWCDQLVARIPDPRLRVFNYAVMGGQILGSHPKDGTLQLALALREPGVDLIIASFGINDLRHGTKTPQEILEKYLWMAERAKLAGKGFRVTTLAPYTGSRPGTRELAEELNQLLRETFDKDSVIEFASNFPENALAADGVHLSKEGHDLRAIAALSHLYGTTTCRDGTACAPPRICFHKGNSERIKAASGQSYSVLRGFLPEAACLLPAELKNRAQIAADSAADAWNIPLQEGMHEKDFPAQKECMASEECRQIGNCHAFPVLDGELSFNCRPSRHIHCIESEACKNEKRCLNWFGQCVAESDDFGSAE
ncbi:MAG: SGNH/GDSL hydrolase family protein [Candidatus Binatia bacterium]|nr:SGNH/GDSL hydrolase family protein [Candidatus Binatia bacterium]MDG1960413.1 SGNH/GDSL hydrolase family protein [Candidatus Binatia bacterium]